MTAHLQNCSKLLCVLTHVSSTKASMAAFQDIFYSSLQLLSVRLEMLSYQEGVIFPSVSPLEWAGRELVIRKGCSSFIALKSVYLSLSLSCMLTAGVNF